METKKETTRDGEYVDAKDEEYEPAPMKNSPAFVYSLFSDRRIIWDTLPSMAKYLESCISLHFDNVRVSSIIVEYLLVIHKKWYSV